MRPITLAANRTYEVLPADITESDMIWGVNGPGLLMVLTLDDTGQK